MITPLDTIGPPVEALPLSPAILRIEGSEDLGPVPSFLAQPAAEDHAPVAASRWDRLASALLAPLHVHTAPASANALLFGLVAFGVWIGYFAIPSAQEVAPLSSWKGVAYLSTLVPASVFGSCIVLAMGRGVGLAGEFLVSKLARRNAAA